jgi:hypothetical protein
MVISGIGEMAPLEPVSTEWEVALVAKTYEESLKYGKPLVYFTPLTKLTSASVEQIIDRGIPICHSISEVVTVLASLHNRYLFLQNRAQAVRNY